MSPPKQGFATKAIHSGHNPSQWNFGPVVTPLVMSTIFQQDTPDDQHRGYECGRSVNPTRAALETCIATLDNGKYGSVFGSGVGAITIVTSLLESGDHILSGNDIYGGTNLLKKCLSKQKIGVSFVEVVDTDRFVASIQSDTKMIWLETPTNPLLRIADIKAISDIVKKKYPEIILVVDNTFLTSYFQKPLDLGADIVVYSLTKYMNGHSDIIMGAVVTNREDLAKRINFSQSAMGIVPSPFDCSMVLRSLKTLELRMKQHMNNGLIIARFLKDHPSVEQVFHPLLPSHPQYELSLRQTTGHSGMISFYLKGDTFKFLKSLKIFTLAGSLGSYESLAELPSVMSHSIPESERIDLGITDQLIRLSVGLETVENLIEDLREAFEACKNCSISNNTS